MTRPKKNRLYFILATLVSVTFSAIVMLTFFQEAVLFFYTPSELFSKTESQLSVPFRLGGLVVKGSVRHQVKNQTPSVVFDLSDGTYTQLVSYTGVLPDLFREGQGIVAEGCLENPAKLLAGGETPFRATTVLAKHDENYMPPELKKGLDQANRAAFEKSLSQ